MLNVTIIHNNGQHMGSTWAAHGQHMGSTWAAHGQHRDSTWAAHGQHMGSTHARQMICPAYGQHIWHWDLPYMAHMYIVVWFELVCIIYSNKPFMYIGYPYRVYIHYTC